MGRTKQDWWKRPSCDQASLVTTAGKAEPPGRQSAVEPAMSTADEVLPNSASLSDEDLMRQLAAGRQEALGPLHGRYASLVFNLAAQTIDRATAEEIVQDVFVAVWRKAGTFDPARGSFRAWVLRIVHVHVLNELRRRGRRVRTEPDPQGLGLAAAPALGPGPAEEAWRTHRRVIVRAAVEALPPPQRQALSLAFLEDLTHQQIADFLDLPLGTAKTRIRTGLQTLRVMLSPLLTAGLIVLAVVSVLEFRERSRRDAEALRLVTLSDVVPRRLVPPSGPQTEREPHGSFRGCPDVPLAVLTVSHFVHPPAGQTFQAWGEFGGRWVPLGTVHPKNDGSDLLIAEGLHLKLPLTGVKVTLEPAGTPRTPNSPPVIVWPSP
jgi:RNA polymerase sigma-70 factor (ECF subfamily)